MIVAALNQVRKEAEQSYDFLSQQVEAWLSVGASSEASLSDAKLITSAGAFSTTPCSVKTGYQPSKSSTWCCTMTFAIPLSFLRASSTRDH